MNWKKYLKDRCPTLGDWIVCSCIRGTALSFKGRVEKQKWDDKKLHFQMLGQIFSFQMVLKALLYLYFYSIPVRNAFSWPFFSKFQMDDSFSGLFWMPAEHLLCLFMTSKSLLLLLLVLKHTFLIFPLQRAQKKPLNPSEFSLNTLFPWNNNHAHAEELLNCVIYNYYYYYYAFDVWIHGAEMILFIILNAGSLFFCWVFLRPAEASFCGMKRTFSSSKQYNLCSYVNHLYAHTLLCYFIAHVRLTVIHLLYILWIFSH